MDDTPKRDELCDALRVLPNAFLFGLTGTPINRQAYFQATVAPNGCKAIVVTFDQECCLLYKAELDTLLPEAIQTDIVISVQGKEKDDARYTPYKRDRDAEEALLDRFRDPNDPLSILVVTAKLLTGFDAPILQAMYLDELVFDADVIEAILEALDKEKKTKEIEIKIAARAAQASRQPALQAALAAP